MAVIRSKWLPDNNSLRQFQQRILQLLLKNGIKPKTPQITGHPKLNFDGLPHILPERINGGELVSEGQHRVVLNLHALDTGVEDKK